MITHPHITRPVELSWCDAVLARSAADPEDARYDRADLVFLCGSGQHRFTELTAGDLERLGTLMLEFAKELQCSE